jgi:hypothetical protein
MKNGTIVASDGRTVDSPITARSIRRLCSGAMAACEPVPSLARLILLAHSVVEPNPSRTEQTARVCVERPQY